MKDADYRACTPDARTARTRRHRSAAGAGRDPESDALSCRL
jgi:hypothetical protein